LCTKATEQALPNTVGVGTPEMGISSMLDSTFCTTRYTWSWILLLLFLVIVKGCIISPQISRHVYHLYLLLELKTSTETPTKIIRQSFLLLDVVSIRTFKNITRDILELHTNFCFPGIQSFSSFEYKRNTCNMHHLFSLWRR
jgi:hypothetical protein